MARVRRKFSFLKFGVEGCGNGFVAGPSGGDQGEFLSGIHRVISGGGSSGRRSLVQLLGPIVEK